MHVEEQIRHHANPPVLDSTYRIQAPKTLTQPLDVAQCALSYLLSTSVLEIGAGFL